MTQTKQARVSAPAESPAELRQVVDSMARKSNAEPWDAWTLPDFAVTEDTATIVPHTCDEMVNAAAKFINTGISLQNTDNIRVIRLVGHANHYET